MAIDQWQMKNFKKTIESVPGFKADTAALVERLNDPAFAGTTLMMMLNATVFQMVDGDEQTKTTMAILRLGLVGLMDAAIALPIETEQADGH